MLIEIERAYKKRRNREKRQQERQDLQPARLIQPRDRALQYDNVRSARAEEKILSQVLLEPALFDRTGQLTGAEFSSPMLGRAFDALRSRYEDGRTVSLAVLEGFSQEELSHLSAVCQGADRVESEEALTDCIRVVRAERARETMNEKKNITEAELLAYQDTIKKTKGIGGKKHGTE